MADALNLEGLTKEEIAELDALLEAEAVEARQLRWSKDPEAWVVESFSWGIRELANEDGPDAWQRVVLRQIADGLLDISQAVQIAIASGHGIGKSCLVAWIVLWALTTKEDTRGNITANTGTQLSTKTWPEISKWFGLLDRKISSKFRLTSESIYNIERPLTWRMDAIPWSIDRASAFAGLHNAGKRVVVIFDEASEIPDIIWETAEGAMTDADTELLWLVFGNPTINTGRFRECFGKLRQWWKGRQIDSRTVKRTNKERLNKLIAYYGEDHDLVRIRILGVFPRSGMMQFIPSDVVDAAMKRRDPAPTLQDPVVMGVDVARSLEGDETVIWVRRGRDARTFPRVRLRVRDTMMIAAKVVELAAFYHVDAIFVDGGGVGGGVVDRLHQLRQPVIEVLFGDPPTGSIQSRDSGIVYYNRRAEMWGTMRDWLAGGYLPEEADLSDELTGPKYGYKQKDGRDSIILESKDSMKLRSLASPDSADALCLTFALPVQSSRHEHAQPGRPRQEGPYDPFRDLRRQH